MKIPGKIKKAAAWMLCLFLAASLLPGQAFGQEASEEKLLAITFDDGPGPYTAKLLDGLKDRGAKATFFLVGNRVAGYQDIVAREINEGHQVASHSWSHPKLTSLGGTRLAAELNQTADAIRSITGQGMLYLRPPYGSYNETVKAYAGGPLILWSVDPQDWKYRNAATVKEHIVSHAGDGDIILVHDIHPTSVEGALAAIDELQARGYRFVTVEELLYRRGITPQMGQVYSSAPNRGINLPAREPVYDGEDFDETKLETHWAYPSIEFVKREGIMSGVSENAFAPDKYLSRGMLITIFYNLSGKPTGTASEPAFADTAPDAWYAPALAWAKEKGIAWGDENGNFKPEEFVDRQTLYVFLSRYAQTLGMLEKSRSAYKAFTDEDQISDWAREPIHRLFESGFGAARTDGSLGPQDMATRAMTAAVIHHFVLNEAVREAGDSRGKDFSYS